MKIDSLTTKQTCMQNYSLSSTGENTTKESRKETQRDRTFHYNVATVDEQLVSAIISLGLVS